MWSGEYDSFGLLVGTNAIYLEPQMNFTGAGRVVILLRVCVCVCVRVNMRVHMHAGTYCIQFKNGTSSVSTFDK